MSTSFAVIESRWRGRPGWAVVQNSEGKQKKLAAFPVKGAAEWFKHQLETVNNNGGEKQ